MWIELSVVISMRILITPSINSDIYKSVDRLLDGYFDPSTDRLLDRSILGLFYNSIDRKIERSRIFTIHLSFDRFYYRYIFFSNKYSICLSMEQK